MWCLGTLVGVRVRICTRHVPATPPRGHVRRPDWPVAAHPQRILGATRAALSCFSAGKLAGVEGRTAAQSTGYPPPGLRGLDAARLLPSHPSMGRHGKAQWAPVEAVTTSRRIRFQVSLFLFSFFPTPPNLPNLTLSPPIGQPPIRRVSILSSSPLSLPLARLPFPLLSASSRHAPALICTALPSILPGPLGSVRSCSA